jgi:hypothetical protein
MVLSSVARFRLAYSDAGGVGRVIEETDTFVWILGWNGDGDLDDADRRYYEWP